MPTARPVRDGKDGREEVKEADMSSLAVLVGHRRSVLVRDRTRKACRLPLLCELTRRMCLFSVVFAWIVAVRARVISFYGSTDV